MKLMKTTTRPFALFLIFVLSSVSLSASLRRDLSLELKERRIRELSSSGLTLVFHIGAFNRGSAAAELVRYNYRVRVNQREYINLSTNLDSPLVIPPGREIIFALPVKITYALLFQAVGVIEEKAGFDLAGELIFRDARGREEKFAMGLSGEFPIFKDPEVGFLPLEAKTLTLGGADVVFTASFQNANAYELLVDSVRYRLEFAGKTVQEGFLPGDKSLPARGGKEIRVPFIIDFFSVGRDVHDHLHAGRVPCRFSGEIEIQSVWGRLRIPFDTSGTLVLSGR
jgi:LEA14-like dessication related protein